MTAQELCPICGEGHITAQVQMVESDYKGHKADLPLHFKLCDTLREQPRASSTGAR